MAGGRFFERGEAYHASGAVKSIRAKDGGVAAIVDGTRRYRVRLRVEDGELEHDCSCPVGYEGDVCKHCVAVGPAWHAGEAEADDGDAAAAAEADVRGYLMGLAKDDLVALILDQMDEDEHLHRRLSLRAAQSRPGDADLSIWQRALDSALDSNDYVDYHAAYDYAGGIDEVIDALDDLLRAGQAPSVIALAEYGLEAIESVDDSDGWLGGLLERLQALHLAACRLTRPIR